MTENETIDRVMELTVTITRLDAIAERFAQAMIQTEREALGMAIGFIDQVRTEALLETGAYTVDDLYPPLPEDAPAPVAEVPVDPAAPDPKMEKARAALKPKSQKR